VETEDQLLWRTSALLPAKLRALVDKALADVAKDVPGLSNAETAKLLATRAGADALEHGSRALARVDDHLQSVTHERNPTVGNDYGVFGSNPTSFGGVYRALGLSIGEDDRRRALGDGDEGRALVFSPLVRREVVNARNGIGAVLGPRVTSRAELSRKVELKDTTVKAAEKTITAARQHLYANLPNQKQDSDLRTYGFRPLEPGRRPKKKKSDAPASDAPKA
jgi:hypothetical protein